MPCAYLFGLAAKTNFTRALIAVSLFTFGFVLDIYFDVKELKSARLPSE